MLGSHSVSTAVSTFSSVSLKLYNLDVGASCRVRCHASVEREKRGTARAGYGDQVGICHLLMAKEPMKAARCLGQGGQGIHVDMLPITSQLSQQTDRFGRRLAHPNDARVR